MGPKLNPGVASLKELNIDKPYIIIVIWADLCESVFYIINKISDDMLECIKYQCWNCLNYQ